MRPALRRSIEQQLLERAAAQHMGGEMGAGRGRRRGQGRMMTDFFASEQVREGDGRVRGGKKGSRECVRERR